MVTDVDIMINSYMSIDTVIDSKMVYRSEIDEIIRRGSTLICRLTYYYREDTTAREQTR